MLFSSPIFLFLFFPIVLSLYFIIPQKLKNSFLLLASIIFYAWGESKYALVMFFSIIFNYIFALLIGNFKSKPKKYSTFFLCIAITFNLGLLFTFKYATFFIRNLDHLLFLCNLNQLPIPNFRLPLGISFFTFHALSYIIDVYRKTTPPVKNIVNHALYISFFPQLIAGPIIRFHTISEQFVHKKITFENLSYGIQRFIIGLGKKVIIANTLAVTADQIFNTSVINLETGVSWLGIVCYTLQIYYDFSGYSDMAIGLARIFGFTFTENFNYPYSAESITDFWRRWHISLSSWFRDYIYIPLGGNKKGKNRTYFNLFIVFFLCGLWHGASWNFIAWGIFYGTILILEKVIILNLLTKIPIILRKIYTLLIVMIAWVLFRSNSLTYAISYLQKMFLFSKNQSYLPDYHLNSQLIITLIIGILFSIFNIHSPSFVSKFSLHQDTTLNKIVSQTCYLFILIGILIFSAMSLASKTYNPFIYFRF